PAARRAPRGPPPPPAGRPPPRPPPAPPARPPPGALDEEAAMHDPRAHTLLRWLGADGGEAPWSAHCLQRMVATEPGTLLLCSDGLWNYLPDAVALAGFTVETSPQAAARALADFALNSGGSDNITVALAPVPAPGAVSHDPGVS
ncbi:PP2C family protein-serine/threonine phosphatase, partial [Nocardia sp. NPDC058497]|uniref:PP2C family protein-serine/threonine phosphatase n=1 Tax=Nocardia sp. NPDC058497 TaxID=3346529 RepID=UPI00364D811B